MTASLREHAAQIADRHAQQLLEQYPPDPADAQYLRNLAGVAQDIARAIRALPPVADSGETARLLRVWRQELVDRDNNPARDDDLTGDIRATVAVLKAGAKAADRIEQLTAELVDARESGTPEAKRLLARADAAERKLAEARAALDFVARWAWRKTGTASERLSAIQYHPTIKTWPDTASLTTSTKGTGDE